MISLAFFHSILTAGITENRMGSKPDKCVTITVFGIPHSWKTLSELPLESGHRNYSFAAFLTRESSPAMAAPNGTVKLLVKHFRSIYGHSLLMLKKGA